MCRFVLYKGPEITLDLLTTRPDHSIIKQSYRSRLMSESLNGDGFGLAWYVPDISPEPAQFRSIQPAWNNVNLLHLARVSRSSTILAHVRAATPGIGISESNCHPFAANNFAFMHNGLIGDFPKVERKLLHQLSDRSYHWIHGTTDSEIIFAVFGDHFDRLSDCDDTTQRIGQALSQTIKTIVTLTKENNCEEVSQLNLAVTDGERAVVSRFTTGSGDPPSLYYRGGDRYTCENGTCRMTQAADEGTSAMIIASEPLTEKEEGWLPIPRNHMLLVDVDNTVELQSLE